MRKKQSVDLPETTVAERMFRLRTLACFFNDTASTEIYTLSLHDALIDNAQLRCHIKGISLP